MGKEKIVLSTAYLPPVAWFQQALQAEQIWIEAHENYTKQTYRNRCKILSSNGVMDLIIPIEHTGKKQSIRNIQTSEAGRWRMEHWQALSSAYGKSAYFLYYKNALEPFYRNQELTPLFEFNLALIRLMMKCMKIDFEIHITDTWEKESNELHDLRNAFISKGLPHDSELIFQKNYFQVFAEKYPFQANLSIVDLLFNMGPYSKDILLSETQILNLK